MMHTTWLGAAYQSIEDCELEQAFAIYGRVGRWESLHIRRSPPCYSKPPTAVLVRDGNISVYPLSGSLLVAPPLRSQAYTPRRRSCLGRRLCRWTSSATRSRGATWAMASSTWPPRGRRRSDQMTGLLHTYTSEMTTNEMTWCCIQYGPREHFGIHMTKNIPSFTPRQVAKAGLHGTDVHRPYTMTTWNRIHAAYDRFARP
jgi:hypothetical protein